MASDDAFNLEAAFEEWKEAFNTGDLDRFWQTFHPSAVIYDEDIPWRMSKQDFVEHIAFHAGPKPLWESFEWRPRDLQFVAVGDTGHVSGFSTFRGKPRDAGFRQRFMGFTQTWVREQGKWRLLGWHQSPLLGHILQASPT